MCLFPPTYFSYFQSSCLVCRSISSAIHPLCTATLVQRNADWVAALLQRAVSRQEGTFCAASCLRGCQCFSTSENVLHLRRFLLPKCTYLFWFWQLSTAVILGVHYWKNASWREKHWSLQDIFLCSPCATRHLFQSPLFYRTCDALRSPVSTI